MTENQQPATNEESLTTYGEKKSGQKIRLRAILLGSLFALAICLITPFNNAYRQATPLGGGHFLLHSGVVDAADGLPAHDFQGSQLDYRERTFGVLGVDGVAVRCRLDGSGADLFC
jgi:hypothetical protein